MITFLSIGTVWESVFWNLCLITALYFTTFYLVYDRQTKRWKESNIPYVQPAFLIGHKHMLSARKYSLAVPIDQIYKENNEKSLIGLYLGPMPMILLKDQKLIQQVIVKNASRVFPGIVVPEFEEEAQYTINLTANEEKWKFARTAMAPIFAPTWFQGGRFERINETIHELQCQIESQGCQLNVTEISKNAVISIGSTNFGVGSHTIKEGISKITDDFWEPSYQRMMIAFSLAYFPFLQKFEPFRFITRRVLNTMSEILKQQIKLRDQMGTENGDLVDVLRSLEGTSLRQMTGLSMVMIIGGIDTIHSLIDFAFHTISLYPEHQRRIRREVQVAMEKHNVSNLNYEVVRDLSFTFQCIFEVSRLYPPSTMLIRQCQEDFYIPDANCTFRKGDKIMIPFYSLSRDQRTFKDPHVFDPDRFNCKNRNLNPPATLLSFGLGPKKCPAYKHGLIVAAAIIASIVHKYDMKPNSHKKPMDATDFRPRGFTNSPRKNIVVDLVPIGNIHKD